MGGYGYFCDSLWDRSKHRSAHPVVDPADGTRMARMLAESFSSASEISTPALAWLAFVMLAGTAAATIPILAGLLRRCLPPVRRAPISLEPVVFGQSQKSRRSPRHALLQHRILMTSVFGCVLALFVLPAISVLGSLGISALQAAIAFVLPTFVVALHGRQHPRSRPRPQGSVR